MLRTAKVGVKVSLLINDFTETVDIFEVMNQAQESAAELWYHDVTRDTEGEITLRWLLTVKVKLNWNNNFLPCWVCQFANLQKKWTVSNF